MSSAQEILKIERSIVLKAPRSRVWRALTSAEEFASWFMVTISGEFAPGGRAVLVTQHPEYAGIKFPLYVQRSEPEHLFSWKWYPGDAMPEKEDPERLTDVTFTLEEVQGGTRLTVVETGFERVDLAVRTKALRQNEEGWQGQLAAIDKYLHGQT